MGRTIRAALASAILLSLPGCAGFAEFREHQQDRRKAEENHSRGTDSLWKQGYGFNNPNNDRIRQGLEPVNFDGKTDRQRDNGDSFFGKLIGNMIGDMVVYSVKSSFTAVANSFRR